MIAEWGRVKELFEAALEREPAARAAYLDEACADPALRAEVDSLLAAHAASEGFLETPLLTAAPDLTRGTRLGPYEIIEAIGAGGMGDVYRAHDARLGRDVAVKVLPSHVVTDAASLRRFEQEARAASALNHPNIVAIHDTGTHDGRPFMVTELLEGETLAERLARGPLGLRRALECALQIATGLVATHERGIVHRDLKPANLFLTTDGQLKILDFGVAKLSRGLEGGAGGAATSPGLVVGTVGYMSPEQVQASAVDNRSDQFALGCVLYELLTARRPFERPSAAQTLAAVIEAEPAPIDESELEVPREIQWLVARCLAKEPAERYASTRDLARDLELALERLPLLLASRGGHAKVSAPPVRQRIVKGALVAGALAATAAGTWWLARPGDAPRPVSGPPSSASVPTVRYLTHSGRDTAPASSPDGNTIAFAARREGTRGIWLKQIATGSEAPLTAGDDSFPRFAPDGSSIVFARATGDRVAVYRVALVGAQERKVVDDALHGEFSPDGRLIAFIRQEVDGAGITSVVGVCAPDGSGLRELARLDAREFPSGAFVAPRWSPDGRRIAVTQTTLQLGDPTVVVMIDAATGEVSRLVAPGAVAVARGALAWADADSVLYVEPSSVVGQLTSTSSRIALWNLTTGTSRALLASPVQIAALDVVGPGRVVYQTRVVHQNLREVPFAPVSELDGRWLTHGNATDRQPIIAPDGDHVAFSSNRSGNLDLWVLSRRSGAVTRLTDDRAEDSDPAYLPDGRLLWSSNRTGVFEIWVAAADGSGARQVTRDGVDAENPVATPDGAWIVYASSNPSTRGIMKIRPDGTGASRVLSGNAILPEVSPDGAHVAYVSAEGTDASELRVARMADGATVLALPLPHWNTGGSIDQGRSRWLPDGRGLVYVVRDGINFAVHLQPLSPTLALAGAARRIAALGPDLDAESLGVTRDGHALIVSFREQLDDLVLAEGIPGLTAPGS